MKITISDGRRELVATSRSINGVWLADYVPPIPARQNIYARGVDSERSRRVHSKPDNGKAEAKFYIGGRDEAEFWENANDLQDIIESAHRRKGTMRVEPDNDGKAVTFDIESCEFTSFPQAGTQVAGRHIEAAVSIECAPYGRLDPVTIFEDQAFDGPIATKIIEGVPGHVDALGDLLLTDESTQARGFLEVGQAFEFEDDEPVSIGLPDLLLTNTGGSSTTRSGSISTNVARATLSTEASTICRTGPLTHVGKKRLRARVYASTGFVQIRLGWRVGDGSLTYEAWRSVPSAATWYDMALAMIDVQRVPDGTHSVEFYVQGRTSQGVATCDVDKMTPFPADTFSVATQLNETSAIRLIGADDFSGTSGPLTGDTSSSGDVWASIGAHSDGGDFTETAAPDGTVIRTTVSDDGTDFSYGRGVVLGSAVAADARVSVDLKASVGVTSGRYGAVFRFTDIDNFGAVIFSYVSATRMYARFMRRFGGNPDSQDLAEFDADFSAFKTLTAQVEGDRLRVWADGVLIATRYIPILGPTFLASGKCGLIDWHSSATASTRTYRNFIAYEVPAPSVVVHPGRSARLGHNQALRESTDGTSWGRVPRFRGKHLTVPAATLANRRSLLAVRARRLDVDSGSEDVGVTDDLSGSLTVTPRVLVAGEWDGI